MKAAYHFATYILLLSLTACGEPRKKSSEAPIIQTELGVLPKLISLPKQPIAVRWLPPSEQLPDSSLDALLKFSSDDYAYILDHSQPGAATRNVQLPKEYVEAWVPAEVRAKIEKTVHQDLVELHGIHQREPDIFTQTQLSPYIHGSFIPLGDGYILLNLYSM